MSTDTSALPGNAPTAGAAATRRGRWMRLAIGVVILAIAAAVAQWYFVGRFFESTDDAYVGGDVTLMAPKVSGFIARIAVSDNQRVKAGDVLMTLDPRDFDARLAQARAQVAAAQAALIDLQAQTHLQQAVIAQRIAQSAAANAEWVRAHADQQRYRALLHDDAVSIQNVERADADAGKSHADWGAAQAAAQAAQSQLDVLAAQGAAAEAKLAEAQAEQRTAELNLEYTTVRAPIDGYVGNRSAQLGGYVAAGTPVMAVVPAQGLWVDANFKEDQLRKMHPGDRTQVTLDAVSGNFNGEVTSLAPATGATFSVLPAENATGNFTKIVQRVPVRIHLDIPDAVAASVRPGLSATVKVHLSDKAAEGAAAAPGTSNSSSDAAGAGHASDAS